MVVYLFLILPKLAVKVPVKSKYLQYIIKTVEHFFFSVDFRLVEVEI